jgi:hypothetical protein
MYKEKKRIKGNKLAEEERIRGKRTTKTIENMINKYINLDHQEESIEEMMIGLLILESVLIKAII